jgi:hypothetical protein
MAHARCSASAAHRWMACPGSVREGEKYENKSSAAADEGTKAHAEAAACLEQGFDSKTKDPAIQMYLDYVEGLALVDGRRLYVEVKLDPGLTKLHPDMGGTADAVVVARDVLEVIDFKYGAGIGVDAEENEQLEIYAIGALLTLIPRPLPPTTKVTIVQPRHEGMEQKIRSWEFDTCDLIARAADFADAAEATRDPNAPLVPGPHCHFCPAAQVGKDGEVRCPALAASRREMVLANFAPMVDADPDKVAQALAMVPGLKAMIKSLDALAYQMAVAGTPPTGYKLVEKRANRKWAAGTELPMEWHEAVPLSPAQVEKQYGKGALKPYAEFITKQSSGFALVTEDDKRPAVKQIGIEAFALLDGNAEDEAANPPFTI